MFELYELYYGPCTNHSGPYDSVEEATNRAYDRLEGCQTLHTVHIIPRSAHEIHQRHAVKTVRRIDMVHVQFMGSGI